MSSSDTSDDENSALLREAVDEQFINDNMFNSKHNKQTDNAHINSSARDNAKDQQSLRPHTDRDDQFNMLGLSPQFQQYVAKQLSAILDEKLNKTLINGANNLAPKRKTSGIKLFTNSTVKIRKIRENKTRTTRRQVKDCESDNEVKCSEVAVNPENILNKQDVKNWSTRSKAPIFKYKKLKNGTLTSIG